MDGRRRHGKSSQRLAYKILSTLAVALSTAGTGAGALSPDVQKTVAVDWSEFQLTHVTVIDGSGASPLLDATIVVRNGRIAWVGRADRVPTRERGLPALPLTGHTVIPGIVGMHDHLFYAASLDVDEQFNFPQPGPLVSEIAFSAPRLYLAAGVTTLRTTGSMEPYTDLNIKRRIDSLAMPGPDIDVTGPYLEGSGGPFSQMHELVDAQDARRTVAFWADQGATSFKAYTHITRAELSAAIDESHRRGARLTGHLCSVGYREATELGIDNLEHGPIYSDSEFVPGKQPDVCPAGPAIAASWAALDISDQKVRDLIHFLVEHHVALTSTLPVFELKVPGRPTLPQRFLSAMSVEARTSYLLIRSRLPTVAPESSSLFAKEMQFELAFARAGGLLLAGPDPTGIGGVLPGFGDQREIELLVEAGFTPLEAIQVATENGARFLKRDAEIGTVAVGKKANLAVIQGDPARNIADIENVEIVFKDGIGYDSHKLIESVRGVVGIR